MRIKLHTPKSLKSGSGMASAKQFLLSIIATTISIVLTFGTAAIIDHYKKEAAKKEMVMMIISDIDQTLKTIQTADSALREFKRLQMKLTTNPELFDCLRDSFPTLSEWVLEDFSKTTETIFTTSIETFNTLGDVNFVNEVSSFYMARRQYKEDVLDMLLEDIQKFPFRHSLKALMNISFPEYYCDNWMYLEELKDSRDRCMQMMDVSEKDMIKFSNKHRLKKDNSNDDEDEITIKMFEESDSCNAIIEQVKKNLKD